MKTIKLKKLGKISSEIFGPLYTLACNLNSDNVEIWLTRDDSKVGESIRIPIYTEKLSKFTGTIIRYRFYDQDATPNISTEPSSVNYYNGPNWSDTFSESVNDSQVLWSASCYVENDVFGEWSFIKLTDKKVSSIILRDKGMWNANTTYVNESVDTSKLNKSIKYIDIVRYKIENENNISYDYYMPCVSSVKTNPPSDNEKWTKAISMDFAYIKILIADIVKAQTVQSNELLITKLSLINDNIVSTIVAGISSNDNLSDKDVCIWSGSSHNVSDNNSDEIDISDATFKVYNNGKVVAKNIELIGNAVLNSIDSNLVIQLTKDLNVGDFLKYPIYFIFVAKSGLKVKYNLSWNIIFGSSKVTSDKSLKNGYLYVLLKFKENDFILLLITDTETTTFLTYIDLVENDFSYNMINDFQFSVPNGNNTKNQYQQANDCTVTFDKLVINPNNNTYYSFSTKGWNSRDRAAKSFYDCLTTNESMPNWYAYDSLFYTAYDDQNETIKEVNLNTSQKVYFRIKEPFDTFANGDSLFYVPGLYDETNGRKTFLTKKSTNYQTLMSQTYQIKELDNETIPKVLSFFVKALCTVQHNAIARVTEILPNGSIITENGNVVGYFNETENSVTTYTDLKIAINHNNITKVVSEKISNVNFDNLQNYSTTLPDPQQQIEP